MSDAALVTGAAQGIGAAIARRLAASGVGVCVCDLEPAAALAREIGGIAYVADVRDATQLAAAAQAAAEHFGSLNLLVNNAGVVRSAMVHRVSDEDWQLSQDVILKGTLNGFRAVAPWFRDGHDASRRVVNITSMTGVYGSIGAASYASAKAGVIGLTKTMAHEWARFGVTVNAVAPGVIDTRLTDEWRDRVTVPLGRIGTPDDIAAAVAYFCSSSAGYVTGQVLEVTGGLTDVR